MIYGREIFMSSLKRLNRALVEVWERVYKESDTFEDKLLEILNEHRDMEENRPSKRESYPFVDSALEEVLDMSRIESPYGELIKEIVGSNDLIAWYPNTTFEDPKDAIANENYCANLIGETRDMQANPYLFHSKEIIGGLFLMGRGQFYPEHYHPACESWLILSGRAKWKLEDGDWIVKSPGEHFTYTRDQVHAVKTGDEILLALWAWTGDLSSWARWSDTI